jgi:capsular polysaccharide biosynthesis protein
LNERQRATLLLAGLSPEQIVEWSGAPVLCDRVLMLESDGRAGGGRPFSALVETRRRLGADRSSPEPRRQRQYVTRRDAKPKRRWALNEPDVEAVFRDRGFEIVTAADHSLPALQRLFGEAEVVAGLNGAGLAHIVFSPAGTHVAVLLTDSLMRWHADESGARSLWASGAAPRELAAMGDSPRFYAHVAAAFEQHAHSLVVGDDIPLDSVEAFVDDILVGVDPDRPNPAST